jgi:hypothetical protein
MKNVKKGGLCSTHGPARKKCEFKGCSKAAVQGGRCITHGAKKKVCAIDTCNKQAILNGMCKKHHDETGGLSSDDVCSTVVVNDDSEKNGGHQRLHKVTPPHSTKTVSFDRLPKGPSREKDSLAQKECFVRYIYI